MRGTPICTNHDNIMSLLNDITTELKEAKESGQRMEDCIRERKDRINELEAEINRLEKIEQLYVELLEEHTALLESLDDD